jgi:hypothetical protein
MPKYIVKKGIFVDDGGKVKKHSKDAEVTLTAEQAKPFIKSKSIEKVAP